MSSFEIEAAALRADGIGLLHADATLIVVDKPAGMLSVPGRGEGVTNNLTTRVMAQFADALNVHRLDQATSGLMLFARGLAMQRGLSLAFEKRRVDKRYEAVVAGVVPAEEGRIEAPLRLDWPNRPRQIVDAEAGKASLTLWQRLGDEPRGDGAATRLALKPVTGRSHQLRVHLQHIGHPILGDDLYAPEPQRSPRLLLHACAIRLAHPQSGELLSFTSPVPF